MKIKPKLTQMEGASHNALKTQGLKMAMWARLASCRAASGVEPRLLPKTQTKDGQCLDFSSARLQRQICRDLHQGIFVLHVRHPQGLRHDMGSAAAGLL